MKILFVNRLFNEISGGIERTAIALMNDMTRRGHVIELLSWDNNKATPYYPLNAAITWHRLDMGDAQKKAGWRLRLRRQLAIRRLLATSRPDVTLVFQHGPFLTTALAAVGLGRPIIAAERSAPQRYDHVRARKWKPIIFQTFRLADRITVQAQNFIESYPAYLRERMIVIPNSVEPASVLANPEGQPGSIKQLLCVGRLCYPKNQAVLVEAFARLAVVFPEWRLLFIGAGEDEMKLKNLAESRGLSDKISFIPAVKDVESFYRDSHLFCLPSQWEGFPNALAEAMAHGLPAVGFAGCDGVRNLIQDSQSGILATGNGDAASLAHALARLMQDGSERNRIGKAAAAAMAVYSPPAIYDRWENLFRQVSRPT